LGATLYSVCIFKVQFIKTVPLNHHHYHHHHILFLKQSVIINGKTQSGSQKITRSTELAADNYSTNIKLYNKQ